MELRGSNTEQNLKAAFDGELRVRNRYVYFAEVADNVGRHDIGDLFRAIAQNEAEHARQEYDYLDWPRDIRVNLESAIQVEAREESTVYPAYASTARKEGFEDIAVFFDRLSQAEGRHRQLLEAALTSLNEGHPIAGRTVGHSAITMAEVVLPNQANPAGFIHGGEMMKLMDSAAGVVARRHAGTNIVTARVEEINFLKPVHVGDLVLIDATLTFVSRRTMEVRVQVTTERRPTGVREQALTAYFVMVAIDQDGHPTTVPPLLITSEEEERLFEEGRRRYEAHKNAREGR